MSRQFLTTSSICKRLKTLGPSLTKWHLRCQPYHNNCNLITTSINNSSSNNNNSNNNNSSNSSSSSILTSCFHHSQKAEWKGMSISTESRSLAGRMIITMNNKAMKETTICSRT